MPDWTKGMTQTFEYYKVDPTSWRDEERLDHFTKSSITWDLTSETIGTASFDSTDDLSEMYIRIYLITIQNGITTKTPLGTFLIQTPHDSFDGKVHSYSYDAYSPLLELKDALPPIGYYIPKEENIMKMAYSICFSALRPPIIEGKAPDKLVEDFISEDSDTWLSFVSDLVSNAKFRLGLDELSRIIFVPEQDVASMQPVWTYTDDNSSILYPDVSTERDLYGIPNVVEVVYTNNNDAPIYTRIVNDDSSSLTSTVNRGREIVHRDTSPSFNGTPTQEEIEEYAVNLLRDLSSLEHTVTYKHGYCPVRVGDCVMLNYERAGIIDVKAKVVSQSISCEPGCPVDETAVYTIKMWEGE